MSAREDNVLRPLDPSITDENDWPELDLVDVKVLRPGKMLYANLLEAAEQNPVQVIGCLELKEDQEHLLLTPDSPSKRVIIDDVTHYAYGQTEDRSVELWVAGKAGWYNISPAKGYLPTFSRMVQAVDMLYFLMDRHQHGNKQLNPSFKNLCEQVGSHIISLAGIVPTNVGQYVFHTHGDCETREQSAEVFAEHAPFLLRCMIEGDADGVDWKKTNVFVHLRRHFSDVYNKLIEERSPKSDDEEAHDEPEVSTPRDDPAAIAKSQIDAVYQMITELREEGHLAKRRLHLDLLTERLSERYSLSRENATKIVAARASAVIELLDEEDTPGFRWSRYVIHRELTHAASQNSTLSPALLTPLQPIEDSSDDEHLGHTQKSVLRPKMNSVVSGKVMGKRHRNPVFNQEIVRSDDSDDEDEDEDETMEDVDTPSKTRGHELIRTPLATAKSRGRSLLPNSGSAAASLLQSVLLSEPPQTTSAITNVNGDVLASDPLAELNKISDIWSCRMPGCPKTITSKCNQRKKDIEAHALEHDWETQMRVELVESERRMHTTMPVSNLMQYLINQHYGQMRAAFPEVYPEKKENVEGNGTAEHPEHPQDEDSVPMHQNQRSAEKQDHGVNGHTT
ncbi:uncharacterized protein N7482_007032 [Penicillium canariense]|uniref:DNA (cytosine-5)-methyltransferase 1 replication foci domain-containing protein n=1 Tax=Penicillium canariense TaxID=189055 RepID=A0A9W9HW43_9EURO|nr:uncharacterized protein N7482_007032 [Penicillium canariense]KAJ5160028.1 hypothetical protein N7482_007032 [Penicillium canariense]